MGAGRLLKNDRPAGCRKTAENVRDTVTHDGAGFRFNPADPYSDRNAIFFLFFQSRVFKNRVYNAILLHGKAADVENGPEPQPSPPQNEQIKQPVVRNV